MREEAERSRKNIKLEIKFLNYPKLDKTTNFSATASVSYIKIDHPAFTASSCRGDADLADSRHNKQDALYAELINPLNRAVNRRHSH